MAFYNQSSSFPYDNGGYYNQIPYETGYYDQPSYSYSSYSESYYPPPQSSYGFYSYEYLPTQSLIAYSSCNDVAYADPGSIQYAVYHSVAALPVDDDLNFADYDPTPFGGGYDIDQTYGKALPPSVEICYPPSSVTLSLPVPAAVVPVVQKQEEKEEEEEDEDEDEDDEEDEDDDDDDDDYEGEEDEEEEEELPNKEEAKDLRIEAPKPEKDVSDEESESDDSVQAYEVVEEKNYGKVIDQMPPGYGLEAYDLCENLFGYWPCLSKMKMKKKCGECGSEIVVGVGRDDDGDEWKRTADYFFGNPDPYRGWTDQGGYPSGNSVYGYDQREYQQQPSSAIVMYEQVQQYGQNSWFP